MWLACATQEEIAEAVGVPRQTLVDWECKFAENCIAQESANSRDFEPPIYNVWNQQTKSNAVGHFGNSEARWVERSSVAKWEPEFVKSCTAQDFTNSRDFSP